jgi:LCP family protein required for cell wall assembly
VIPRHANSPSRRAPRHARRLRSHGALKGVALVTGGVLLFGASSVAAYAYRLDSNLNTIDTASLLGKPTVLTSASASATPSATPTAEDPNAGRAVNILVLGSDQRTGDNAILAGEDPSMASDTTIVVHISADRSRVELVSIPRDSLVPIPSCQASNGKTTGARSSAMFNEAFAIGWEAGGDLASAAACTGRTVQDNTGLTIDHFIVVDFIGFRNMVDAIGGVNICIPRDLHDKYTGLNLTAGQQVLNGTQAIQLARARHGNIGNGGDIDRIGNQQRLISAMVNQVLSTDVLTSVTKLTSFLDAATSSLTRDSQLSTLSATGLAYSMRNIRANDITFMTIPTAAAPSNKNRLVWTSEAATIWANMVADVPIVAAEQPAVVETPVPGSTTAPATTAPVPVETKTAGREAFTSADVTGVCTA